MGYAALKTRTTISNGALWLGFMVGAGMGVLVAVPEALLNQALHLEITSGFGAATVKAFLVSALPEEGAKFVGVLAAIALFGERRRLQDVLLLALGVGMGFAALENLLYLASAQQWMTLALVRGVAAVPAHGAFGLTMGALLIAARVDLVNRRWFMALAFAAPVAMHGAYDSAAMATTAATVHWTLPMQVLVMGSMGMLAVALCNMVLPEAVTVDRRRFRVFAPDARISGESMAQVARVFVVMLLAAAVVTGFSATICWYCAFFGVLPLTLMYDLIRSAAPQVAEDPEAFFGYRPRY